MERKNTDQFLVTKIKKEGCNRSIETLIERHSKLYYSICNKYYHAGHVAEVYSDKHFVIYRAIQNYNPDRKTKFSTWLGNMTKYHCLNKTKKEAQYIPTEDKDLAYFLKDKALEKFDRQKIKEEVDYIFEVLDSVKDKRISKIFKMRYLSSDPKMTWKKIALEFRLTPQTIINLHGKGKKILKKKMEK